MALPHRWPAEAKLKRCSDPGNLRLRNGLGGGGTGLQHEGYIKLR
jgi:hypothetical protein